MSRLVYHHVRQNSSKYRIFSTFFCEFFTSNTPFLSIQTFPFFQKIEKQENSIIYYENTYIQNSGIDYKHPNQFEIISILDGTIIEVSNNELLGTTVKIRHENDLISTYQSLSQVNIKVDDVVLRGQVIGTSGTSKIYSTDNI